MTGFSGQWYVAGGWALDLFLNRLRRPHDDLDIVAFRCDQVELYNHLIDDWPLLKVTDDIERHHLSPWERGDWLELPVFQVVLKVKESDGATEIEVLFAESEGDEWYHREWTDVRRPLSEVGMLSEVGVPYLAPEIVLFYKSGHVLIKGGMNEEKDQADFKELLPHLSEGQRAWLRGALHTRYGEQHPWLDSL